MTHPIDTGQAMILVGLGNIGSHLAPHLASMPEVGQVTLIDPGQYETKNLSSQAITAADVGRWKVEVQGQRLRSIRPDLQVKTVMDQVQNVPLGRLRGAVILAGLDSREARRALNQAAWRLGVPWIDGGVDGEGLLARVNVYRPGPEAACLECAWSEEDYAALEQHYPCQDGAPRPAATNAPTSLGALAAALQALECRKILSGQWDQVLIGQQVLLDAKNHKHYLTSFRRHRDCRFDHQTWQIRNLEPGPEAISIHQVSNLDSAGEKAPHDLALRVEGKVFVRKWSCPGCGAQADAGWRLSGLLAAKPTCERCGRLMLAAGFDSADWLQVGELTDEERGWPLERLGFQAGDVMILRRGARETLWEIGEKAARSVRIH